MLEGTIVKGIGGFYYVKTLDGIYECRARGVFREKNITPLVGDKVIIREKTTDKTGYVEEILERKTQLHRPPVSNVTQAVIVMSIKNPNPNLWLLDRFLLLAEKENLYITIVFNKIDLEEDLKTNIFIDTYAKAGYRVITTSCKKSIGVEELKSILKDNITVFAGPSGVGKSSLINKIQPGLELKTGEISDKTKRGKHTTRHVELMELDIGGYILDTPGFSSLNIDFIQNVEDVQYYFKEIKKYSHMCRFNSCLHINEPECEVKRQVEEENIGKTRYENYLSFVDEIKSIRRY
ncbi:ribosome small subunit-dependent GTPase A [Sporanaerobacter acetigenes]|uniref:Small ribosomal subunit biogenesis GTPase RsgA n=1 Tax=Sporanaerobacter acetigenes DSM 13106 TaxID=1123281 RepID=A0A1M5XX10_9FIRM|nr:ribosome small subunit-dependent GTPase A [Sporanaerobacter acetigenes]SHI04371.1 ribosome biogenesis GTPase [Sporanaerobacter acetigenes DSM 13106]